MQGKKIEEREKWIFSFESGKRWLNKVAADSSGSVATQRGYIRALWEFSEWVKKDPDAIIAERRTQLKSEEETTKMLYEEKVREYRIYLQRVRKIQARAAITALVSFFKSNYADLKLKIPSDAYTPRKPSNLEQIRAADLSTSLHNRLIIRFLLDAGMSREDAVEVSYGDIREEYEKGLQFIHLEVIRRKENIRYDTFVGSNFLTVFRQYKQILEQKGVKFTDKTPLLAGLSGQKYSPQLLTTLLNQLGKKLGFDLSPHRIRKLFETLLSMEKVHPLVLKFWMGHAIGSDVESHYILPSVEEQRKIYSTAYSAINLEAQSSVEARLKELEAFKAGLTPEQLKAAEKLRILSRIKRQPKSKDKCEDGSHCEKIIGEVDLEKALSEGWKYKATLPSGRIVVAND